MSKADRLRYGQTMMTHAMLFTGVDVSMASQGDGEWRTHGGMTLGRRGSTQ